MVDRTTQERLLEVSVHLLRVGTSMTTLSGAVIATANAVRAIALSDPEHTDPNPPGPPPLLEDPTPPAGEDRGVRVADGIMRFDSALHGLRHGLKVKRRDWPGHLTLDAGALLLHEGDGAVPYLLTTEDVLATDWVVA